MPGISLGNATAEVIKSPWLAFIGCAIPALDGGGKPGKIVLEDDAASGWKTPAAGSNPNAFFLGCTSKGWAGQGQTQTTQETCDEFTTPISTSKDSESYIYEADLLSIINDKVLATVFGLEAISVDGDAFKHYRQPSGGNAPEMTFLLVSRRLVGNAWKYNYVFAPKAQQTASFGQGNFTRTEMLKTKVRMEFQLYSVWGTSHTLYFEE